MSGEVISCQAWRVGSFVTQSQTNRDVLVNVCVLCLWLVGCPTKPFLWFEYKCKFAFKGGRTWSPAPDWSVWMGSQYPGSSTWSILHRLWIQMMTPVQDGSTRIQGLILVTINLRVFCLHRYSSATYNTAPTTELHSFTHLRRWYYHLPPLVLFFPWVYFFLK